MHPDPPRPDVTGGQAEGARVVWAIATTVFVYGFLQFAVVPLLPVIQQDVDVGPAWGTWIFTSFLLVSCVSTPVLGNLGDQFGKRRVLLLVLCAFVIGCIGSALAPSIAVLILFRSLQGVSGAVFGLGFAAVRDALPPHRVGFGIGVIASATTCGGVTAVMLSGVIADVLSWRWVFGLSAIAGVLTIAFVARAVPESTPRPGARIDIPGTILLTTTLLTLLIGVTEGNDRGWTSPEIIGLFAAAVCACLAWIAVELRASVPVIDVRMLARRSVLLTNGVSFFGTGFAATGVLVLVPRFAVGPGADVPPGDQYGYDLSVATTTLVLLPYAVAGGAAGVLGGLIGRRRGRVAPLVISSILGAAGTTLLALWHGSMWQALIFAAACGASTTMANGAAAAIVVAIARPNETAALAGMNSVIRHVGSSIGAQVTAAVLGAYVLAGTDVPSSRAFEVGFRLCAVSMLVALVLSLALARVAKLSRRAR